MASPLRIEGQLTVENKGYLTGAIIQLPSVDNGVAHVRVCTASSAQIA